MSVWHIDEGVFVRSMNVVVLNGIQSSVVVNFTTCYYQIRYSSEEKNQRLLQLSQ